MNYVQEPRRSSIAYRGLLIGVVANVLVVLTNVPFLLIRTDRAIRPMIWPAFYLLIAVSVFVIGLPMALREKRAGLRGAAIAMALALTPLPVGIATFWLFCWAHGVTVEP